MVLDTTSTSLIFKLAGAVAANELEWSSSWSVRSAGKEEWDGADGASNGTSEVTLVTAPESGVRHVVTNITIHNKDTAAAVVIVEKAIGATRRRQARLSVPANSSIQYTEFAGWSFVPEEHNSVTVADLGTTGAMVVGTTLNVGTDATIGDDLTVADDCQIGDALVVGGVSTLTGAVGCSSTLNVTGTLTAAGDLDVQGDLHIATFGAIAPIAAKGDLLAGTANDTLGVLSVGNDNNCVVADSSQATGLTYGRRSLQYGAQIADASAWHSSTSESGALYTQTIVAGRINTTRAKVRVKIRGKASTTGSPSLTMRVKMDDGAGAQTIGTVTSALPGTGTTDTLIQIEFEVVVRTTGSTGTVNGHQTGGIGTSTTDGCRAVGEITLDLTAAIDVTVTAQWSASSASNTVTLTGMEVEIL